MLDNVYLRGTFNAKWLTPQEVAANFIPVLQFQKLVHSTHSILFGPRGCGKTTLLKMLTRSAISTWDQTRAEKFGSDRFQYPDFEAIYIPSDVRWAYELESLEDAEVLDSSVAVLLQRVFTSISILNAILQALQSFDEITEDMEIAICEKLISEWQVNGASPLFSDLELRLSGMSGTLRGFVNQRDAKSAREYVATLAPLMAAHVLDAPMQSCHIIDSVLDGQVSKKEKWALCFDELEIAPKWLREEVLSSLRSVDQKFLLKLTFTPLLPSGLSTNPEPMDDYNPIRLWYSHVHDADQFCQELAQEFFDSRFGVSGFDLDEFFQDEGLGISERASYKEDSRFYSLLKDAAEVDENLLQLLASKGIEPSKPIVNEAKQGDEVLRKLKPIIILRDFFLKADQKGRSRKSRSIYSGKSTFFAMSEANPRWLLGLLTDVSEKWQANRTLDENQEPRLPQEEQAATLRKAANRFRALISALPSPSTPRKDKSSLAYLVDRIGDAFQARLLGPRTPLDPVLSFTVQQGTSSEQLETIRQGIIIGAFVYVGQTEEEIPKNIIGSRFRLTFRLAPRYKLPVRNYRAMNLAKLLVNIVDEQMDLYEPS